MVARYAGASLGLFAFAVAVGAGLLVRNPIDVTLSRGILALFIFCLIGMVLGEVARAVVAEHEKKREAKIRDRYRQDVTPPVTDAKEVDAPDQEAA